jgi:biotin-(acetyl-CoA carboxylase) ligase
VCRDTVVWRERRHPLARADYLSGGEGRGGEAWRSHTELAFVFVLICFRRLFPSSVSSVCFSSSVIHGRESVP